MSDPRLVFDTNVVVSAVLFLSSVPARALELGQAVGRLLVSDETAEELRRVLMRTKFDRYVRSDERARFLGRVLDDAMLVEIIESIDDCRDPQGQQVFWNWRSRGTRRISSRETTTCWFCIRFEASPS